MYLVLFRLTGLKFSLFFSLFPQLIGYLNWDWGQIETVDDSNYWRTVYG